MKKSNTLILLLFALSVIGIFLTNAPVYTRLLYLTSILILGSWLWGKLSLSGISLHRKSRSLRGNVGDVYDEHFEISNNNFLPSPWLEIQNNSPLPISAGSRLLVGIKKREKRTYLARTWLTQRGAFPLGPTMLSARDPLGLFRSQKSFPATAELIVLPLLVNISNFPAPPGLLPGGKVLRQKSVGITPHAAGVREYAPGDALRRIHWKTSARRQKLMVKEFDQDPQSSVWIFLDAQRFVQAKKGDYVPLKNWDNWMLGRKPDFSLPPFTIEYAVTSAASLSHYFIQMRRAVGLIVAGQKNIIIPADRGLRQEEKILETLAFIQAEGKLPLEELVAAQAGQLSQGCSAVLITPSYSPKIMHAVEHLLRRKQRVTVVLLDAESFGGNEGSVGLEDSLKKVNTPVCRVNCGDDLGVALSNFRL